MKKIYFWEPWFFIFFGVFHLHRIWGLIDRNSYAEFWLGILGDKGALYFSIMSILAFLCITGIITFIKNKDHNYIWRWIYFFGGGYLLFDLFAIEAGLGFWNRLLSKMFDINNPYWNIIWSFFVLLGCIVFILGIILLKKRSLQNNI